MKPKSTPKVTLGMAKATKKHSKSDFGVAQGRPKSIPETGPLITDRKGAKQGQKDARSDPQKHEISTKNIQKHTLESIPAKVDEQALTRDLPNLVK